MRPLARAPTASNTSWMVTRLPSASRPGRIDPPYRNAAARSSRAAAISIPGRLLSQPASSTVPSKRSACTTSSTESAMTSRETSEARIPSCPIEIPSLTAIVQNSNGTPPASRTPAFACWASRCSGKLHGVTSFHEEATPICGRSQSSSPRPTARSMARAGARSIPSVTSRLRGFLDRTG